MHTVFACVSRADGIAPAHLAARWCFEALTKSVATTGTVLYCAESNALSAALPCTLLGKSLNCISPADNAAPVALFAIELIAPQGIL